MHLSLCLCPPSGGGRVIHQPIMHFMMILTPEGWSRTVSHLQDLLTIFRVSLWSRLSGCGGVFSQPLQEEEGPGWDLSGAGGKGVQKPSLCVHRGGGQNSLAWLLQSPDPV